MKVFFIVHGFVQGVGYRALVKKAAEKHEVKGIVRNANNGTVEILAEADDEALKIFENEINVGMKSGPSVVAIEKYYEGDNEFPKTSQNYEAFVIGK